MGGWGERGFGAARAVILALAVAVSLVFLPVRAATQTASPAEVKAAFLYNFAKFVEWPPEATSGTTTINVGVWGSDALGEALRTVVRDKAVGGRGFTVKRPAGIDDLDGLHMLFIGDGEKSHVPDILKRVDGMSVLTVSDIDRFCEMGGTITLFIEDSHVRFDVRLDSAQRARLKVSSKLLNLARRIHGARQGDR